MGKYLDSKDFTKDSFERGIEEVVENKEYKKAAEKAKYIMGDVPMKSKDLFLYWINYVIRHKGAQHLIAKAPFELNVFQYLSLDVAAFLVCILLVFVVLFLMIIRLMCKCLPKGKKKQE